MEKRKNAGRFIIYAACLVVVIGLVLFSLKLFKGAEKWALYQTNRHVYSNGEIINIGAVTDKNGVVLAHSEGENRIYNSDANIRKSTIHAVGDTGGYISTGVQNALREELAGYSLVNGFFNTKNGNNAVLTIDSRVNVAALKALGTQNGCVGICNYKTGEIICMVSTLTFDIANKDSFESAKAGELGSVFVNKFISSTYTPGSTFKIITAAAAIDSFGDDAYKKEYICNHGTEIEEELISCLGEHGTVSLTGAFTNSCNAYFSQLGLTLGRNKITEYAEKFGFNKDFYINGIKAARSSFNLTDTRNISFGWASIGQYRTLMNPLQMLCNVSAIANGGEYITPYFVESISKQNGKTVYKPKTQTVRVVSKDTADKLYNLMDTAVLNNYGKGSFGQLDICGKTGTAEVGQGVENSLFVGFSKDENFPVAFVVIVEGGGSGRSSAMGVANWALQSAKQAFTS